MSILYLTGVSATGKTSITERVIALDKSIKVIRYSEFIMHYLEKKYQSTYSNQQLRELSSMIISPQDIANIDKTILSTIKNYASSYNVIIESHAITKEDYGFRATPFSIDMLKAIAPNIIVALYASPEQIYERISIDPSGRKKQSIEDISYGQFLLSTVALHYGLNTDSPVYFLDSSNGNDYIAKWILSKLQCNIT